jgi:hypothetical protein
VINWFPDGGPVDDQIFVQSDGPAQVVPEPGSALLTMAGLAFFRRRIAQLRAMTSVSASQVS